MTSRSFRSRPGVFPALSFALVAAAGGCGGGTSSPISLDEAQARVLAALCQLYVSCGEAPDLPTCLASIQEQPGYRATLNADIASGKVVYDGVKARACVEFVERYYGAGCTRTALAAVGTQDQGCAQIFVGTVAPGGACHFAEQCAGGGDCESTDPTCLRSRQCCAGTCQAEPAPIPVGGDCASALPGQSCVTGAVCARTQSGGALTCLVPSTVEGTPCNSFGACALSLYCDTGAAATGVGTCRRVVPTGAACNPVGGSMCDDLRDFCDQASGTCTRGIAVGGTCDPARFNCAGDAECIGTTCVAQLKAGEACSPTGGPTCLGSLECDPQTNTCALAPVGGVCI